MIMAEVIIAIQTLNINHWVFIVLTSHRFKKEELELARDSQVTPCFCFLLYAIMILFIASTPWKLNCSLVPGNLRAGNQARSTD